MATAPTLADPLLDELAGRMQRVQLAFYLLLLSRDQASLEMRGLPANDAAWVELSRQGEEFFVFPKNFSVRDRVKAVEKHSQLLVNFLLRHMIESPGLAPRKGAHCLWCSSAKLCIRTAAR